MFEDSKPDSKPNRQIENRAYSPSWIDRIVSAIDRLPGPAWIYYVALALAVASLANVLRWMDRSLQFGSFDPFRVSEAFFAPYMLGAIHYLGLVARASLDSFRSVLGIGESELSRIRYELTTTPARQGFIIGLVGVVAGILNLLSAPAGYGISEANAGYTYVYAFAFAAYTSAVGLLFFWHITRQLRHVNRIHAQASHIDIIEGSSLYSFSRLTALTGLAILVLIYFLNFFLNSIRSQDPSVGTTPLSIGILVAGNSIAIASFVLPLYGMHMRLARKKTMMIEESTRSFHKSASRLHAAIDEGDMATVDSMHRAMTSLNVERQSLDRISTWPWPSGTGRGFFTAIALPILLFLITRILEKILAI